MRSRLSRHSGVVMAGLVSAVTLASLFVAPAAQANPGAPPSPPGYSGLSNVTLVASIGSYGTGLATDGAGHLFAAAATGVYRMNLNGSGLVTLATGLSTGSKALRVAPNGKLWYGSESSSNIYEMNADGSGKHVVATVTGGPSDFAFDGFGHVYVTTLGNGIWKMNTDGSNQVQIASGTYAWGIAYDHAGHLLYANAYSGGYRMNLDGSSNGSVVSSSKMEGVSTQADGTVIWSDYGAGQIFESRSDGSDSVLIASGINRPEETVAMPGSGTIYFISWSGGSVYRINYSPYAVSGNNSATVSWAPSTSPNAPVTSYTVVAMPWSGGVAVEATVPGTQTTTTMFGLVNATAYQFSVYATNPFGDSASSFASNLVVPGPQYPDTPIAPSASRLSGAAKVTWSAPNGHGAGILGYSVTAYQVGHQIATARISAPGAATSVVVGGLSNGAAYQFTVLAVNAVGVSTESLLSAPVVPSGPPSWSSAPTASALSRAARVTWSTAHANGSPITGYKVLASPGGRSCTTTGALACTVTGLSPGVTYSFKVIATNHLGSSASPASNKVVAKA